MGTLADLVRKAKEDANASLQAQGPQMAPTQAPQQGLQTYQGSYVPNGPRPDLSNYTSAQDLVTRFMTKPIDEAEQAKRERQAKATAAIGHLGNTLSSFSNLIFTGAGAPSQTLPEAPNPDLKSFQDRLLEQRSKYADAIARAQQMDRADYDKDYARWFTDKQYNDAQKAKEIESQNEAVKYGNQRADVKFTQDMQNEQMEETKRHNRQSEGISGMNAQTSRMNAESNRDYRLGQGGGGGNQKPNPTFLKGGKQYESLIGPQANALTIASLIDNSEMDDTSKRRLKYALQKNNSNADLQTALNELYQDNVAGDQFLDLMIENNYARPINAQPTEPQKPVRQFDPSEKQYNFDPRNPANSGWNGVTKKDDNGYKKRPTNAKTSF